MSLLRQIAITLSAVLSLALTFRWTQLLRLIRVNSLFSEKNITRNFSNMRDLFFFRDIKTASATPSPLPSAPKSLPESLVIRGKAQPFKAWQEARQHTALLVLHKGKVASEAYYKGTTAQDLRISWSMAKSVLSALFGIAVNDGLIPDLDAKVTDYVPSLNQSAYQDATIRHVLNMASGITFNEDYLDFHSDINRMGRVLALGKSMDGFTEGLTESDSSPGTYRHYVSIDTHVIGMVLRAATGRAVADYLAEKLLLPLGMEADCGYLTDGFGTDFVLGGLNLTTRDYARFGLMILNEGYWNGQQIVPKDWVKASAAQSAPPPCPEDAAIPNGQLGYGYQWWLPPNAREGEVFAIGIYGQYIYIDRQTQTVIALNASDRNFREGDGAITLENLSCLRQIADHLAGS